MQLETNPSQFQSLLLHQLPPFPSPKKLPHSSIPSPPPPFPFPLSTIPLSPFHLLTHSNPQYLNKYVSQGTPPLQLLNHKSTVCMIRQKQILIGNKKIQTDQVSCVAKCDNYFLVAKNDKTLLVYDQELKMVKEIGDFSGSVVNQMVVVPIANNTDVLILVTTSGSDITMYQLYPQYNHHKIKWHSTQSLLNNKNIIFCQYLKPFQLLFLHQDNTLNLYYTKDIDWLKTTSTCSTSVVTYSFPSRIKPYPLPPHHVIKNYLNTMFFEISTLEVYCLEGNNAIGTYQLAEWKGICEKMREEGQYEEVLKFGCSMWMGLGKYGIGYGGREKEKWELGEYVRRVVIEYVDKRMIGYKEIVEEQLMKRLKEDQKTFRQLTLPFQTLILTSSFQFLFSTFLPHLLTLLPPTIPYRLLSLFILSGTIKSIPQDSLKPIFSHYLSTSQPHLLQTLIINFDLQSIQIGLVIHYCLQNVLVSSLAYICTHKTSTDFITPLVKFYGMAQIYRQKGEREKAVVYAEHALWYIDLCMKREMELMEIEDEIFWGLISTLTEHLWSQGVVTTLLELKLERCLKTLESYFLMENAVFVGEYVRLKGNVEVKEWVRRREQSQVLEMMLGLVEKGIENCKRRIEERKGEQNEWKQENKKRYQREWYLFLSKIILNKTIKFKKQKYIDILSYLISNHLSISLSTSQKQPSNLSHTQQISQYLNKILVQSINQVQLTPSDLSHLSSLTSSHNLLQVQVYISYLSRNYSQALSIYFTHNDLNIFPFILNTFKLLTLEKRKGDVKVFEEEVKRRIGELVVLDAGETTNVAKLHFPDSQDELIAALKGKQPLQLEYLQNIITSKIQISEKATLLFTTLMCKLKPQKLIGYFEKYPIFPIESTLKICEKYQIYSCLSYLYNKMGNTYKSIELSVKRIEQIIKVDPQLLNIELQSILSNLLSLCILNRSQQLWQQLFDSLLSLAHNSPTPSLSSFFQTHSTQIFYQLLINCPISHTTHLLQSKYSSLKLSRSLTLVFLSFYRNYLYNQNMMYYAIDYQKEIVKHKEIECVNEIYKGAVTKLQCSNCEQSIDKSKICLAFRCGHTYHKECVIREEKMSYCVKCLDREDKEREKEGERDKLGSKKGKFLMKAKELKEQMLRKFSEEETEYEEHMIDNYRGERVRDRMRRLEEYQNVRGAVDQISNGIMEKLEYLRKIRSLG